MKILAFCKRNVWVMQNHGLEIHIDKIWAWAVSTTQNTQQNLTTYTADLPKQPKYLEHLKKALIGCP